MAEIKLKEGDIILVDGKETRIPGEENLGEFLNYLKDKKIGIPMMTEENDRLHTVRTITSALPRKEGYTKQNTYLGQKVYVERMLPQKEQKSYSHLVGLPEEEPLFNCRIIETGTVFIFSNAELSDSVPEFDINSVPGFTKVEDDIYEILVNKKPMRFKLIKDSPEELVCDSCKYDQVCETMKSPIPAFKNFMEFCGSIFSPQKDYEELSIRANQLYGIENIDLVPIEL